MGWERARSKEQKEQRIADIVDATARLYKELGFEDITFVRIAKEAKFTRSNLYKYFDSKEEIFLELISHDIVRWRKDVVASFPSGKNLVLKEFASKWARLHLRHKRLLNLMSILHNTLEKNVSLENLVAFKRRSQAELLIVSEVLCGMFPKLTIEQAAYFLELKLASAIGLFHMTDLSEMQQRVLDDPEFEMLRVDFMSSFEETIEYLLSGLLGH